MAETASVSYEVVYSPLFVPKGSMYQIDRTGRAPGLGIALVFHDEADHALWVSSPHLWTRPVPFDHLPVVKPEGGSP